jgi:hypothetical protein
MACLTCSHISACDPNRPTRSSERTPKDDLIRNTKTLRIAGFKPSWSSNEPVFNVKSLLRDGDWRLVTPNPEQKQRHQQQLAAKEHRRLIFSPKEYTQMSSSPPFSSLERLVLGQSGVHVIGYDELEEGEQQELAGRASAHLSNFVGLHSPRFICTHSDNGETPYGLKHGQMSVAPNEGPSTITRHMHNVFTRHAIIAGAKNRWTAYPGACSMPEVETPAEEETVINGFLEAVRLHDSFWELSDTTSVDMYGQCMPYLETSYVIPHNATIHDKLNSPPQKERDRIFLEGWRIDALQCRERSQGVQRKYNAYYTEKFNTSLKDSKVPGWVNKINFLTWQDIPVCQACGGWEPESYREEELALLEPTFREQV